MILAGRIAEAISDRPLPREANLQAARLDRHHHSFGAAAGALEAPSAPSWSTFTGTAAGAVVLDALALELILKARLLKAAIPLKYTHSHIDLFAKLPQSERTADEEEFRALLNIPMVRTTQTDVLAFSARAFKQWRYLHERHHVKASMGEMQRAFRALEQGMRWARP
jgi:hypothetical protein